MSEDKADYVVAPPPAGSPVALAEEERDRLYLSVLNTWMVKALDMIECLARQCCHTDPNTRQTDSGAISTNAEALYYLAEHKRFKILRSGGRMVMGYWPENEPRKRVEQKETNVTERGPDASF